MPGQISIHALLAESDASNQAGRQEQHISIHALLAESDYVLVNTFLAIFKFLSTLSLRRATGAAPPRPPKNENFYPRSPCGERQQDKRHPHHAEEFLSTLSLRRATTVQIVIVIVHALFLSTLSLRRATQSSAKSTPEEANFYPRSPCGERQLYINRTAKAVIFLSTLSLRRATTQKKNQPGKLNISIHALLAESDQRY